MEHLVSRNPATGREISTHPSLTEQELSRAITLTGKAFTEWADAALKYRIKCVEELDKLLLLHADELAQTVTLEMGKPIQQSLAEVHKCRTLCQYYLSNTAPVLEPHPIETEYKKSYIIPKPLGTILGVMPWNFPVWQVFRAAIPTLLAGNTFLLQHAPNVQLTAAKLQQLFDKAQFPKGILTHIPIRIEQTETVISHRMVAGVTLTGSTRAGSAVAALAGKHLKPVVLELGGSDPFIVLADADPSAAADAAASSRLNNAGQSCIAAKRMIVEESILDPFLSRLSSHFETGPQLMPQDPQCRLGPLARADIRDRLAEQVKETIRLGAKALCGAEIPQGPGYWYPPTVLTNIPPGSPADEQELFGPVASVFPVPHAAAAIQLANQSRFGLGASIFTRDTERGEAIIRDQLACGFGVLNDFVRSDPRLPFGGIRDSGFGREMGPHGLLSFTNLKTVLIQ